MNDGGSAFPEHHYFDPSRGAYGQTVTASEVGAGGMSLRDYFAAKASNAVISLLVNSYLEVLKTNDPEVWNTPTRYSESHCKTLATVEARYRYALADAMLAERSKK